MAVKKIELEVPLIGPERMQADALEQIIDRALCGQYSSKNPIVTVILSQYPEQQIRREIGRRYNSAGWSVHFENNPQGDGPSVRLS